MAQDAMQGIMGLGNAPDMAAQGMQGMEPGAQAVPSVTREQLNAFEQARSQVDPAEFAEGLLRAGEEVDASAVQQLRQQLSGLQLPAELIGAMLAMVEAILAEPNRYPEIRQELIAEGVPADILPEQLDPEYFGALQLALEQMSSMPSEPMRFADGGIVSLKPIAKELQNYGRNGDTMLAHITPSEARMLQRMGGSGTINPITGLPEFFLGGVFKAVGNAFKSAGKAVVGAVKGVVKGVKNFVKTPVGRIVTAVALGFFVGPAAATLLGSGLTAIGATTLAGVVGSTAGVAAISGFVGGFGSTMLAGGNVRDALKTGAIGGVLAGAGAGVMGGAEAFAPGSYTGPTTISGQWNKFTSGVGDLFGGGTQAAQALPVAPPTDIPATALDPLSVPAPQAPGAPTVSPPPTAPAAPPPAAPPVAPPIAPPAPQPGLLDRLTGGIKGLLPGGSPGANPQDIALKAVESLPPGTSEAIKTATFQNALKEATPSALAKYGPYVAGGLGIMGLTGGFKEQEPQSSGLIAGQPTGYDLLQQDPQQFGVNLGPVQTVYNQPSTTQPYESFYTAMAQNPYVRNPTRQLAQGGPANPEDFPRKNGAINGPGTEKSDSIPAMLSDGEFVFTAQAVRGAGNGSRRDGAKRMYQMMKQFERNA